MIIAISSLVILIAQISLYEITQVNALDETQPNIVASQTQKETLAQSLDRLKRDDKCGTIFSSKKHGFDIKTYKVTTNDKYELNLHRIIHPSDFANGEPVRGAKKPYLLLHGLIGTSASFVRNAEPSSTAQDSIFNLFETIDETLSHKWNEYEDKWQSVAEKFNAAFEGDTSATLENLSFGQKILNLAPRKQFSSLSELDYDGDSLNFGREFKQAYRKFELPRAAKKHLSNSLAFTLSNFGYDVWLINLRGNKYSRSYNGRLSADSSHTGAEYWDFNIDTIIKEDLPASINKIRQTTNYQDPIGLVSFSYSSIHVLGLLTKFPAYQESLQPVILMAPTLLTSSNDHNRFRYFMKMSTNILVSKNGPFPALGRTKYDKVEKVICKLPIASKLCRLLETVLHGRAISVRSLLSNDQQSALIRQDSDCGQTSTAVLHQIIDNLSQENIQPKYMPFLERRNKLVRGAKETRRSVMLVHSEADKISTLEEVNKMKNSALKSMVLADLVIKEPNFDHTHFLFSRQNEYLVNAEIVRMAALFDFMIDQPPTDERISRERRY